MARTKASSLFVDTDKCNKQLKEYLAALKPDWQRSVETILTAAKAVAGATELPRDYQSTFREKCKLDKKLRERLQKIGRDARLYKKTVQRRLPRSYASLEELTRFSEEQFAEALKKGLINKDVTRQELKSFRQGRAVEEARPHIQNSRLLLSIRVDKAIKDAGILYEICDGIQRVVLKCQERHSVRGLYVETRALPERIQAQAEASVSRETKNREQEAVRVIKEIRRKRLGELNKDEQ